MFHIRVTKTASFSNAVQVVKYEQRKLTIGKHIGSAHTSEARILNNMTGEEFTMRTMIPEEIKYLPSFTLLSLSYSGNDLWIQKIVILTTGSKYQDNCFKK